MPSRDQITVFAMNLYLVMEHWVGKSLVTGMVVTGMVTWFRIAVAVHFTAVPGH